MTAEEILAAMRAHVAAEQTPDTFAAALRHLDEQGWPRSADLIRHVFNLIKQEPEASSTSIPEPVRDRCLQLLGNKALLFDQCGEDGAGNDIIECIRLLQSIGDTEPASDTFASDTASLIGGVHGDADAIVDRLLKEQQAAAPDGDPGDIEISIQDDAPLVAVRQPAQGIQSFGKTLVEALLELEQMWHLKQSPPPKPTLEETIQRVIDDFFDVDMGHLETALEEALIRDGHVKGEEA